jgi:hypothetical protein
MQRDDRLDVWRGLCLVDVVLVHLAFNGLGFPGPLDDAIKHWTRFAAGGFVFLAGLTVAVAFGPAVARSAETRARTYRRLWRRAGQLMLIEIAASVAYRLLDPFRWFPSDPHTAPLDAAIDLVLLRRPGVMGGILVLYAILLAVMPLLFEVRRRAGDWPLVGLSLALYAVATATGGALAWPDGEFHVVYWQPLFVTGLLAARGLTWLDTHGERGRLAWAVAATAAFAAIFVLHHGPQLLPLGFDKKPLQPGALLWYLAAVQVVVAWTLVGWDRLLAGSQTSAWLALLGRHSLLFYVAHVFTEIPVMELVWNAWPPAGVRLALAAADLGVLAALCAAADGRIALPAVAAPRLLRGAATTALAATCAVVLWTVVPETAPTFTDLEEPVTIERLDPDDEPPDDDAPYTPVELETVG